MLHLCPPDTQGWLGGSSNCALTLLTGWGRATLVGGHVVQQPYERLLVLQGSFEEVVGEPSCVPTFSVYPIWLSSGCHACLLARWAGGDYMANTCWRRMPFRPKNVRATYQWLVNKMFANEIDNYGGIHQWYHGKEWKEERSSDPPCQTFAILREYNMKSNSKKCSFWVGSGKFLGHIIS